MKNSFDVIAKLTAPIPDYLVKSRTQGGQKFNYVEWITIVTRLNETCGINWEFRVTDHADVQTGDSKPDAKTGEVQPMYESTIWGELLIDGKSRANCGFEDNSKYWTTPGQRAKSATSDCFKRCAAMWGIALELHTESGQLATTIPGKAALAPKQPEPSPETPKAESSGTNGDAPDPPYTTSICNAPQWTCINKMLNNTLITEEERRDIRGRYDAKELDGKHCITWLGNQLKERGAA